MKLALKSAINLSASHSPCPPMTHHTITTYHSTSMGIRICHDFFHISLDISDKLIGYTRLGMEQSTTYVDTENKQ